MEKSGYLNMQDGSKICFVLFFYLFNPVLICEFIETLKKNFMTLTKDPEDIVAYLKGIKRGMIVLAASFDDVTPK